MKKTAKAISRFFARAALIVCNLIIKMMPFSWLYGFADGIAWIGYRFVSKHRNIALDSLSIAFGSEKTGEDIERIAKECFAFMAKSAVEIMFLMDKPELLRQRVAISGRENLDRALSKGRGVILVSAHFGNFPLLLARLSLEGYRASGIMRRMRDSRAEKIFLRKREIFNVKTIYSQPRRECVNITIKALRNNELVFIPIDQNFGTAGVFVDFFGQKAATATGPVIFAQRTKAGLVPCFIVRQKDDTHRVFFEPELALEEKDTPHETILLNIQRLTDIIEKYIRKYPAEWGWIHRRWKTKSKN